MSLGSTITMYLMDGRVDGRWRATSTYSNLLVYKIPHVMMKSCADLKKVNTPGVYFLYGKDTDESKPYVYVGEGDHCLSRIMQTHDFEKAGSYWAEAVLLVANDGHLEKGRIKYLENRFYNIIKKAGRYILKNAGEPVKSPVEDFVSDMLEQDIIYTKTVMQMFNYQAFLPTMDEMDADNQKDNLLYYSNADGKDWNATGIVTSEGFVVLKGSLLSTEVTDWCPDSIKKLRTSSAYNIDSSRRLKENQVFNSPSYAADFVSGRNVSGLKWWRNKDGVSLGTLGGDSSKEKDIKEDDSAKTIKSNVTDVVKSGEKSMHDDKGSSSKVMSLQMTWRSDTGKAALAYCELRDGKYYVLSGSRIKMAQGKGFTDALKKKRDNSKISSDGVLQEEVEFNSSSTAASFVVGGSRDGKLVWKTKEGKKLAEMLK